MIIIFYDTIPCINYTIIQTQIFSNFASTFQQQLKVKLYTHNFTQTLHTLTYTKHTQNEHTDTEYTHT